MWIKKEENLPEPVDLNITADPSYRNLQLPFYAVCRQRYLKDRRKHRNQFLKEVKMQELFQSAALNGVRIHRIFAYPVLQPVSPLEKITLTAEEIARIDEFLKD